MKKHLLTFAFIICSKFLFAQPWSEQVKTDKPKNFYELQKSFNKYWENREIEKGVGYKKFRRWEWYFQQRLNPDSSLPASNVNVQATLDYQKAHPHFASKTNQFGGNWTSKGPNAAAGGYSGLGRITCIAFHPTNNSTYWVGTPAGGLWKTTNNGQTWTTNTDNLPVLGITSIAINPTNPNTMYIATGDGDLGNLSGVQNGSYFYGTGDTKSLGVFKSTDGGATWNTTGLSWNTSQIKQTHKLLINPNNPAILLCASSDGIFRTTNSGTSWTNVASGNFNDIEFKPGNPSVVHAATFDIFGANAQIFLSTNGGVSFTQQTAFTAVTRLDIAVSAALPNLVDVVGIDQQGGLAGIVYSDNSGLTYQQYIWGDCQYNLIASDPGAQGCGGQGMYDLYYVINPQDEYEIWLGGVNTWATPDGGTNYYLQTFWNGSNQNPGVPEVHADQHFFAFHPNANGTQFVTNDGGIYKSTNGGGSWIDITNGMQISEMYRIAASQSTSNKVLCGLQDNGSKYLAGTNWSDVTGGDGTDCAIDYTNDNIQYGGYVYGQLFRTTDAWQTQTTISNNIPGTPQGAWITPFEIDPVTPATIYAGYDKVYKSTNKGNSWTAISPTLTTRKLNTLQVAPSNTQHIYAANWDTLFSSTNGGGNWYADPVALSNAFITGIAINPNNDDNIWISLSGYANGQKVIVSYNGGLSFSNYSGSLPNLPINCIIYENNTANGLYVGTDVGIYYRDDNTGDWIPFSNQLPNVPVADLDISYNDGKLWAGTFGRGLWKSDLFSASANIAENDVFENVSVYPNPAKDLLTIKSIKEIEQIKLMNGIGQILFDEKYENNTAMVNIDLKNYPPSVYTLVAIIDGKIKSYRVIKN